MSSIHLLFPPGELRHPDGAWHELALSTRRFHSEESQVGWRNSKPLPKRRYTGHSHQRNFHGNPEHTATWRTKHLHSKTHSRALREQIPSIRRSPNYREPTVPHNRGHRYSISPSYWPEVHTQGSTPHSVGESTGSPSTIYADCDSPYTPDDSVDIPWTLGSVCDQFRFGTFGYIFDCLRLTDNERNCLEELAQPDAAASQGRKRRAPAAAEIVQTLSQTTYSNFVNESPNSGAETDGQINDDRSSIMAEPVGDDD